MAAKRDLYEVLGISKTADEKTIKKAYRKLAKKYHPDMNPGDKTAEQKFKEATDAYNILSDPEKRKLYDQYGHAAFDGTGAESEFYKNYQNYGGAHGGYQEFHFEGGDGDDIFGDIFGSMFGGGRNNKGFHRSSFHQGGFGSSDGFGGGGFGSGSFRQKGSDAHADISISFDEAVTGCDKVIHLQDQNGAMQSLQVHIPAGIDTGKSVRLRGKGNPGIGGGEAGDLFLKVTVGEKQGFERKGNDVHTTINVPFSTAVCGGEAVIKTLYGNVICKIKEGTQSGSKIRLRGKGMPGSAGGYDGDLLLKVQVGTKAGFERKEMDVYTKAMIPFTTAVFGGEVIVPTLYGKVLCTIRPGTQSGTKIRLRGKGIVSMNHKNMYGDQYVTVQIEVPKNLNAQAKEKLKEYEAALRHNTNGHVA